MTQPKHEVPRRILVDSPAFYALLDRSDQWHALAAGGFHALAREASELHTTGLILAETHALAVRRLGLSTAQLWLESLAGIGVIHLEARHVAVVTRRLRETSGQGYSFADTFSFVAMEESRIGVAFTFDRHFSLYGLTMFP